MILVDSHTRARHENPLRHCVAFSLIDLFLYAFLEMHQEVCSVYYFHPRKCQGARQGERI